jgi:hypothetical protein
MIAGRAITLLQYPAKATVMIARNHPACQRRTLRKEEELSYPHPDRAMGATCKGFAEKRYKI